ncbi:putative ubiquitin carboxyl-terminal hydrolase [Trypanosoma cruzi]|uniref:Ubiquitin carboxyl-terminal hydrolase n=2 Tax=Trypanosoma cruzi TaxID=5693 RepID=Q4DR39_TRYCC|nr:ubiquitin carboxyl-terminal hydrolase, putative [Trypanosoma cruzi]EAN94987.1 ubiquitin carboxyl-terminal hydrolase, putative [Trypanosoma cruzi]PWV19764.1 putative ubiquitin carboxyl-terminal hydrolase [Trypanosoma cruzi]RNC42771.1 ubiquitin carboxyl-terminal hydrolase [Trypanosoma cruzi]|eukprot:XP_816838.1 ubiquitin carboxyl-terminal hydrolase [Trypanosoma cruzi strain CL Brener]
MAKKWLPIESNPDVLNTYLRNLGVPNPKVEFCDVYGLDPDLLVFLPRPVRAMILLYPITPEIDAADAKTVEMQAAEIKAFMAEKDVFFSKQTVENACGTMALLHAVMNNLDSVGDVRKDSPIDFLRREGLHGNPEERALLIESDPNLDAAHMGASAEGVTKNQPVNANIDLHFTCFVHAKDQCVELDGRKQSPLLHGACMDNEQFVSVTAEAIQAKISRNKESFRFNIIALVDKSS